MTRPNAIRWASYLVFGSIVIGIPFSAYGVATAPEHLSKTGHITLVLVFNLAWFALAWFLARGRRWAQLLLALGTALTIWNSRQGPPSNEVRPLVIAHFWIQILIMAAVLVLVLLPSSTAWIREQRELRKAIARGERSRPEDKAWR